MPATTIAYRCPFCETVVEIDSGRAGESVTCTNPRCRRQFRAELPSARPVTTPGGLESGESGTAAHEERILKTVHPVLLRGRPLAAVFCLAAAVLGVAGLLWALLSGVPGDETAVETAVLIGSVALLAGAAGTLLVWWIQTRYTSLTITDGRSLLARGFISRETSEVRHQDIRNLQTDQSFIQRLLGVGTLAISSAGQDDFEITVRGVRQPEQLAALVREHQ